MRNTFTRYDSGEPLNYGITLTEAKQFLRVDHTNDDTTINLLITSSLEAAESELGFPIISRSMSVEVPVSWTVQVAPYHVNEVTSVYDGATIYADYDLVHSDDGSYITFSVLPDAAFVSIDFTTGVTVCPSNVKLAMLKYVVDNYEQRTSEVYGVSTTKSSFAFDRLLHSYKRYSI